MSPDSYGTIITFYSYKGGTGRSMALANIACVIAQMNPSDRILIIDWDLEAPGLHSYFQDRGLGADFDGAPGLIDLFVKLDEATSLSQKLTQGAAKDLIDEIDLSPYMLKTDIASLYLLKAGRFDDGYSRRVNSFDWERFYKRCPWLIQYIVDRLESDFKYVLIDSRTGLTDISGICTMLMPEKLVLVFTPNRQSLTGLIDLVKKAVGFRMDSDPRPLVAYPVASRIEAAEPALQKSWRFGDKKHGIKGFQPEFEQVFKEVYNLKECDLSNYFDQVQIPQSLRYAYGEKIAVLEEKAEEVASTTRVYEIFTKWLVDSPGPWEPEPKGGIGPQTLDVEPGNNACFQTITQAIEAAIPGDRILVSSGIYEETLNIDKNVEIIGKSKDETESVQIKQAGRDTIRFGASTGRLNNINVQQTGGSGFCAVRIIRGTLEVDGCSITSQGLHCVAISKGAESLLRGNKIQDGRSDGVHVHEGGRATLIANSISGNAGSGVMVEKNGDVTLRDNIIKDNGRRGIYLKEASGKIDSNKIIGNNYSGVDIERCRNIVLRRNRIYEGKAEGVYIHDENRRTVQGDLDQPIFQDNEIFGNTLSGVRITTGANPTLRGNVISNNFHSGIHVDDEGRGLIENNESWGNSHAGVAITSSASPTLTGNSIHDNAHEGIYFEKSGGTIEKKSGGTIEKNDIYKNSFPGVVIIQDSNPTVRRNRIYNGKAEGVFVHINGRGLLEENEIYLNFFAGVAVSEGGNPTLRNNEIFDGRAEGIHIGNEGQGVIEDNEIRANHIGVVIEKNGNPTLRNNLINRNKKCGVCIKDRGQGLFESNRIENNLRCGVCIKDQGQGLFESNRIENNLQVGVLVSDEGNPTFQNNHVKYNKDSGVYVKDGGQGVFECNEIEDNGHAGVAVSNGSNPTFSNNDINRNVREGIYVEDAAGIFNKNTIRDNVLGHWYVCEKSLPRIKREGNKT